MSGARQLLAQTTGQGSHLAKACSDGGIGIIKAFFYELFEFLDRIGTWNASQYRVDDVKEFFRQPAKRGSSMRTRY
jgi:hypothetical protein